MARQRDTYYVYIAPFMDSVNNVLTFMNVRYHIPDTPTLESFHAQLTAAIERKDQTTNKRDIDHAEIIRLIKQLEPYRINFKAQKARKQTRRADVFTTRIVND